MRPYNDVRLNSNVLLREFNVRIDDIEFTWHRDTVNRIIEVFSGAGWQLQLDNQIPVLLEAGCEYHIPTGVWHRLHRGSDNLTILISEEKKKLSKKQMKIAQAAPPPDEITGADFKALNKNKKAKNEENYLDEEQDKLEKLIDLYNEIKKKRGK
jgi:hypothetical protein